MKRIIVVLLVLTGFTSQAQWPGPYTPMSNWYEFTNEVKHSNPVWFTDSALFTGPTRVPTMVSTDSSNRAASTAFVKRNFSSLPGCINGLTAGTGLVTQVGTSRVFNVAASKFIIECSSGGTDATSITIPAISDTPRIDVIYVDNTNTVKQYTGTESYTPIPHTLSSTELALAYINVYPDSIVVTPVTPVSVFNNIGGKAFQNTSITYGGQTAGPWVFTGSGRVTIQDGNTATTLLSLQNTSLHPSTFDFKQDSLKGLTVWDRLKNAARYGVDSAGVFRIWNLTGSGTRMVVANANGVLSTQAIPGGGGGVTQGALDDTAAAIRMTIPLSQVVHTGNSFYDAMYLLASDSTWIGWLHDSGGEANLDLRNVDHTMSTNVGPGVVTTSNATTNISTTVNPEGLYFSANSPGNLTVAQVPSFGGTGDVTVFWPDKRDGTGTRKDTLATIDDIRALHDSSKNATFDSTQFNVTTTGGEVNVSLKTKVYYAVLSQSGTGDPIADSVKGNMDAVTWTRSDQGFFTATRAGGFPPGTIMTFTYPIQSDLTTGVYLMSAFRNNNDGTMSISKVYLNYDGGFNSAAPQDGLTDVAVKIEIPL